MIYSLYILSVARQLTLLAEDDHTKYDNNDFMSFECPFRFTQILEDKDLANKVSGSGTIAVLVQKVPRSWLLFIILF